VTAINEAYARIDYSMLLKMQAQIDDLKKLIPTGKFSAIQNENYSIRGTAVFAQRKNVAKDVDEVVFNFAQMFDEVPVVTASIGGNSANAHDPLEVAVIITEIDKNKVTFEVGRKSKKNFILNVIAVGKARRKRS
jgi:hypothetical protein